jgi:pilus assembly protein CpaF
MSSSIVVFVNAKGGSGATTLALEAARVVKKTSPVALVDADLQGRRTMAVLLDSVRQFDDGRGLGVYSVVANGGITSVELTDSYDNAFALSAEAVDGLAKQLSEHHELVIVDAPAPFAAAIRPLVTRASRYVVVLEPNLLGTATARTLIGDLAKFGIPLARIWIVTNTRAGRAEISSRELEKALGASVVAEVPLRSDRGYQRAIEGFAKRLESAPSEPMLTSLRPASSTGGPIAAVSENGHAGQALRPARVSSESRDRLKMEIREQVTKRIDVVAASRAHTDVQKIAELRAQIGDVAAQLLGERADAASIEERLDLQREIIDELLGLGPLEDLMRDESVSEIMVNGPDVIYIERRGKLTLTDRRFNDERHLRTIIERIIAPIGRRIDEASPMVDARLPDGSRVNAIIEPLALGGSTLTIRRFGTKRLGMDDLVRFGSIVPEATGLLKAMVEARLNVIVSGGTGSGKTTFLNILTNYIPEGERIVTIEDAAELKLNQEHVVRLESRPANVEGRGAVSIRDLVKNSLRMRPDRIVVGECRSGEALDMLQAMNTGHDGSMTTLHANTPRDALARLETLVLMAGFDLPVRAIREQIASAVHCIVQIERVRDGSRKVVSISEVVGMEGDTVTMQEVIRYAQRGVDTEGKVQGEFQFTGVQPHYTTRFEEAGVEFDGRSLTRLASPTALW